LFKDFGKCFTFNFIYTAQQALIPGADFIKKDQGLNKKNEIL